MNRPTLVIVSGTPGSGKTTLARELAISIPCPLVSRDEMKEGMAHAQPDFQGGRADSLTQLTFPLFFEILRMHVDAAVTVVAEAAFQDSRWREGIEPLANLAELRIVRCRVDPTVSFERARSRAAGSEPRRRAHGDSTADIELADWITAFQSFEHLSVSAPTIDVDTTDGYEPSLLEIVAFINHS